MSETSSTVAPPPTEPAPGAPQHQLPESVREVDDTLRGSLGTKGGALAGALALGGLGLALGEIPGVIVGAVIGLAVGAAGLKKARD